MRNYPNWDITINRMLKHIDVHRKTLLETWVENLPQDQQYIMRIEPKVKPKSNEQLGYYHGLTLVECLAVINQGSDDPITKRELDAFFSKEFLTIRKGTKLEGVLSKGGLTTAEFAMFIEHVACYMAENYGYVISQPDKNWKKKRRTRKE